MSIPWTKQPIDASSIRQERRAVVLIAEDEEPIAEALADVVRELGYEAICAPDGRRALEVARKHPLALVITDYMMPYMNGGELIVALRAEARELGVKPPPIILMSAAGPYHLEGAQADALLDKPFDLEHIEGILRHFLQGGL